MGVATANLHFNLDSQQLHAAAVAACQCRTGGVSTFRPCFGNPPTGPKNALKCFSSIAMHCPQLAQHLPLSSQKLVLMFCPTYKPLKIMPFAWQVYTFCYCLCHTLDHATAAQRQTALPPRPVVGLRVIPRAFPLV